ncbi:MAG: phosphatase PAP2 family protein [Clostridiales bacterium]|nr:phosphatase PAP2 family protein [Clostridiales bacterium]
MELSFILWTQSFSSQFLDVFFQAMTLLGEEIFILLFFTILYWTINKDLGQFIGYSFFISLFFNTSLKEFFHMPRPIGIENIRSLRISTATGYSFPSGHTQAVTSLFASLSIYLRKKWLTILSAIIISLVGLSRIYLGVHWPKDVLGAIIISLIIVFICYFSYIRNFFNPVILSILFLGLPVFFYYKNPELSKSYGILLGYFLGLWYEKKYIHFRITKDIKKNISRVAIGLIGLLFVKEGFKVILPIGYISDAFRYFLISFYGIGFVPWIIEKYNL